MSATDKELIAQLNQARQELERWKEAVESTGDGVWDWNPQTDEIYFSAGWKEMLGYSTDEIHADINEWKNRVHPDDLDVVLEEIRICLEGGRDSYESEHRLLCKDGVYRWILDRGRVTQRDEAGKATRFIGTHVLIDRRKRLEAELAASNLNQRHFKNLLQYIIEHSNGAVAIHDKDLNYIYVSQRYLTDYQVAEKDIIGRHHYEIFPDLPQKWRDVHQKALQGEVSRADRDPYYRDNGTVEWTRWECRPWFEEDGTIGGLVVYTEVITKQVEAENRVKESEAKYRALFENMALASCIDEVIYEDGKAIDYRILEVNPAFEKITGLSASQCAGNLASQVYGTGEAPFLDVYSAVAENGTPAAFETWFEPLRKHLNVTVGSPKPGFFSTVFADITERKNMEIELNRLKNQLEQEVQDKTKELSRRIHELERFREATVEREFRMKELREEIIHLKKEHHHH